MKFAKKRVIVCVATLVAVTLANTNHAFASGAPSSWEQLVAAATDRFDLGLYQSRKVGGETRKGAAFFQSEAECVANSNALLSVNGLLVSGPVAWRLGTEAASSGATVVYIRLDFLDGNYYRFICLISRADKLERTRMLDKNKKGEATAVEIDNANYRYIKN